MARSQGSPAALQDRPLGACRAPRSIATWRHRHAARPLPAQVAAMQTYIVQYVLASSASHTTPLVPQRTQNCACAWAHVHLQKHCPRLVQQSQVCGRDLHVGGPDLRQAPLAQLLRRDLQLAAAEPLLRNDVLAHCASRADEKNTKGQPKMAWKWALTTRLPHRCTAQAIRAAPDDPSAQPAGAAKQAALLPQNCDRWQQDPFRRSPSRHAVAYRPQRPTTVFGH